MMITQISEKTKFMNKRSGTVAHIHWLLIKSMARLYHCRDQIIELSIFALNYHAKSYNTTSGKKWFFSYSRRRQGHKFFWTTLVYFYLKGLYIWSEIKQCNGENCNTFCTYLSMMIFLQEACDPYIKQSLIPFLPLRCFY